MMLAPVGVRRRKKLERHQCVAVARLDDEEGRHQHDRRREHPERLRGGPAHLVGLGEAEDQQHQAGGHGDRAEGVEVARQALDAALAHETADEQQGYEADRHIDPEDPLPARVFDEDPAEQHPDRGARARDGPEDAQRLVAVGALLERDQRDREHRRRQQRRRGALQEARGDQHAVGRRDRAQQREDHEGGEADHEDAPPAEQVAGAPAEQQETTEGEGIAAHDPLEVLGREAEVGLDRRQGDVHDRDVEDHHEVGDAQDRERLPAIGVGARGVGGHPALRR